MDRARGGIVNSISVGGKIAALAALQPLLIALVAVPVHLMLPEAAATLLWFSIAAIVLSLLAGVFLFMNVAAPLGRLGRQAVALAPRAAPPADEIAALAEALDAFRGVRAEAEVLRGAVEAMPIAVMLADPDADFAITYMNPESLRELKRIGQSLPVRPAEMIGRPIGILHKDPQRIREMLRDPAKLPFRDAVNLAGREDLALQLSAVRNAQGKYVSTLLTWTVITKEVETTRTFEASVKATVDQVSSSFQGMRERIDGIAASVDGTRRRLSAGAEQVADASKGAGLVARSAEALTTSLSAMAGRVGQSIARANDAAREVGEVAGRATALAGASDRIGQVVGSISQIAYKTNLLALNATIEAASAGAAGRGFAVVAHEVKTLADQTAKATDEVTEQTNAVRSIIADVVAGVSEVAAVIGEIRDTFAEVAAEAGTQQAATRDISATASRAAAAADAATAAMREVEGLAASNLDAARALGSSATEIARSNDNLAKDSDALLRTMKAR